MSTHTIGNAARQDARRLMNSALLRMAATVALSVLFALVNCIAPADQGQGLASPAGNGPLPAVAQAAVAAHVDSLDHP